MRLENATEIKTIGSGSGRQVTVVVTPLSKELAREEFLYRPKSRYAESRFGGDDLVDDVALLLNGHAERCGLCQAPTKKKYLVEEACPDCDGRSEYNGTDPRAKV